MRMCPSITAQRVIEVLTFFGIPQHHIINTSINIKRKMQSITTKTNEHKSWPRKEWRGTLVQLFPVDFLHSLDFKSKTTNVAVDGLMYGLEKGSSQDMWKVNRRKKFSQRNKKVCFVSRENEKWKAISPRYQQAGELSNVLHEVIQSFRITIELHGTCVCAPQPDITSH